MLATSGYGVQRGFNLHDTFVELVKEGVARGEVSARHDAETLADIIVGALSGGIVNWTVDRTYSLETNLHNLGWRWPNCCRRSEPVSSGVDADYRSLSGGPSPSNRILSRAWLCAAVTNSSSYRLPPMQTLVGSDPAGNPISPDASAPGVDDVDAVSGGQRNPVVAVGADRHPVRPAVVESVHDLGCIDCAVSDAAMT